MWLSIKFIYSLRFTLNNVSKIYFSYDVFELLHKYHLYFVLVEIN